MSSPLQLGERPQSLSSMVYTTIKDAIVEKRLEPGRTFTESGLARELQVSKTPVREALLRLREAHLVEEAGNQLRVTVVSLDGLKHAYEVRCALERTAASMAALRASEEERGSLARMAIESVKAAEAFDNQSFAQMDQDFHEAVADASRNPYLVTTSKNAIVLTRVLRARDVQMSGHQSIKCAQEHVMIADAVANSDQERAGELAADHVQHVMDNVVSAFLEATKDGEE